MCGEAPREPLPAPEAERGMGHGHPLLSVPGVETEELKDETVALIVSIAELRSGGARVWGGTCH